MISDDERRAVARRLRRSRSEWSGMGWRLWLGPKFCAVVLSDGNKDELEDAAHRLADLIEPAPSCELWNAGEQECYSVRTVRPVDRDALLALADDLDYAGANVENVAYIDQTFHDAARRIREACGEAKHGR